MITEQDLEAFGYWDALVQQSRVEKVTPLEMVREFAEAMGQPLDQPHPFDFDGGVSKVSKEGQLELLRVTLIAEEVDEFDTAHDKENLLKELADIVYVVFGYAATYGLDLDEAVRRVHLSNMSKLGDDGKPIVREDGKIMKSDNYQEPYLEDLI